MSWIRPKWLLPTMLCLLSVTGCSSVSTPCKPLPIPPLPTSVVEEATRSSDIPERVQSWLRSVLPNSDAKPPH